MTKEDDLFPEENQDLQSMQGSFNRGNKDLLTLKQIILNQIEKCRIELSKDLREGGTYETMTSRGVIPLYFPDQREVIVQSVETFYDLMSYYLDEKLSDKIKYLRKDIKNADDDFYKIYLDREINEGYLEQAKKYNTIITGKYSKAGEITIKDKEAYLLRKYRDLFRELVYLFKVKRELSEKRVAGN